MDIKTHPSMTILYASHRTTFNKLNEHIGSSVNELYAEAVKQELMITGPIHWIYYGADGKPDTEFTLEIGLPVEAAPQNRSKFSSKQLSPFKCLRTEYVGDWEQIAPVYHQLIGYIHQNGLGMTGECRELYLNVDFGARQNNITEIQIGLR